MIDAARVRAARTSGSLPMAASFASLNGGDTPGTNVAADYLSTRSGAPGTRGWETHGITPSQEPMTFLQVGVGLDGGYDGEFSDDLSTGIYRAFSPVTDAPNVADVNNLYLRTNLRAPGAGSYQLLTDCAFCGSPLVPIGQFASLPKLADTSDDFSVVLFESLYELTPDAPVGTTVPKLYKAVNGVVTYVGILPASQGGGPAPRSIAGQGAGASSSTLLYTPNTLSDDGSRAFFTVPPDDSSRDGDLYMRDDQGTAAPGDDTTIQLNASERTVADAAAPAAYEIASADGERVWFTSREALTDDADVSTAPKLYMYDASRPASDPDNLTLLSDDLSGDDRNLQAQGVVGVAVGDDGRYHAYFIVDGQIVAGGPDIGASPGLYRWSEGEGVTYLGVIDDARDISELLNHHWSLIPGQPVRVTPDGAKLLIGLRTDPETGRPNGRCTSGVSGGCRQFYLYTMGEDRPTCVSCSRSGVEPTSDAAVHIRTLTGGANTTFHQGRAMTDDGSRIFFDTGERLVLDDANGALRDVYEYDVASGEQHLISTGTGEAGDAYFMDASADGDNVFFLSSQAILGWDRNDDYDLYNARVLGGFPEPPAAPLLCEGEQCQGRLDGGPPAPELGSESFRSPNRPPTIARSLAIAAIGRRGVGRTGRLSLRVNVRGGGTVVARVRAQIGRRSRIVASARRTVRGTDRTTARLSLRLNAAARRKLDRNGRLRLRVAVTLSGARTVRTTLVLREAGR